MKIKLDDPWDGVITFADLSRVITFIDEKEIVPHIPKKIKLDDPWKIWDEEWVWSWNPKTPYSKRKVNNNPKNLKRKLLPWERK